MVERLNGAVTPAVLALLVVIVSGMISPDVDVCNLENPCFVNETDFYPYPGNCSLYYMCNIGDWLARECAAGTEFSTILKQCDNPDSSCYHEECPSYTGSTTVRTTLAPGLCFDVNETYCIEGEKAADRSNCSWYYRCIGGQWDRDQCPRGNYYYLSRQDCVYYLELPDDFQCYDQCPTPPPTTGYSDISTGFETSVPALTTDNISVGYSDVSTGFETSAPALTTDSNSVNGSTQASTTSSTTTQDSGGGTQDSGGGTDVAMIVGIVMGVLALIIIIVVLIVCYIKKKKKASVSPSKDEEISGDINACLASDEGNSNDNGSTGNGNSNDQELLINETGGLVSDDNINNGDDKKDVVPIILPPLGVRGPLRKGAKKTKPKILSDEKINKKANKARRQVYGAVKLHPTREEVLEGLSKYSKSLAKILRQHLMSEQGKESVNVEQLIQEAFDNQADIDQSVAEELLLTWSKPADVLVADVARMLNSDNGVTQLFQLLDARDSSILNRQSTLRENVGTKGSAKVPSVERRDLTVPQKDYLRELQTSQKVLTGEFISSKENSEHNVRRVQEVVGTYCKQKSAAFTHYKDIRLDYTDQLQECVEKLEALQLNRIWKERSKELYRRFNYNPGFYNPATLHDMMNEHINCLDEAFNEVNQTLNRSDEYVKGLRLAAIQGLSSKLINNRRKTGKGQSGKRAGSADSGMGGSSLGDKGQPNSTTDNGQDSSVGRSDNDDDGTNVDSSHTNNVTTVVGLGGVVGEGSRLLSGSKSGKKSGTGTGSNSDPDASGDGSKNGHGAGSNQVEFPEPLKPMDSEHDPTALTGAIIGGVVIKKSNNKKGNGNNNSGDVEGDKTLSIISGNEGDSLGEGEFQELNRQRLVDARRIDNAAVDEKNGEIIIQNYKEATEKIRHLHNQQKSGLDEILKQKLGNIKS